LENSQRSLLIFSYSSKNSRVKSFSPISKSKDSFGLYYDQAYPDSAETKLRSKPITYFSKKNLGDYKMNDSSREKNLKYSIPAYSKNLFQMYPDKGLGQMANYSNNDNYDKKSSNYTKWASSQIKYKGSSIVA
jgi:hypothetical protein